MPQLPIAYILELDLEQHNWMRVHIESERGQVLSFVVQYEMDDDITRIPVVRFDSAHGLPHRDMMYRNGDQQKTWLADLSYNEAVVFAINDIKQNWEQYREAYFRGHL